MIKRPWLALPTLISSAKTEGSTLDFAPNLHRPACRKAGIIAKTLGTSKKYDPLKSKIMEKFKLFDLSEDVAIVTGGNGGIGRSMQ